jgi:hypothetical protein
MVQFVDRDRLGEWVHHSVNEIIEHVEHAGRHAEGANRHDIEREIERLCTWWHHRHPSPTPPQPDVPNNLTMNILGGNNMASFSIVITDTGAATAFQFDNSAGSAVAGPNDSVTGAPVAPEAASDTPTVLTVAPSVAGATAGAWTAALTPVAAGVANISPVALVNSDGSPVNETEGPNAGQPFVLPAAVQVTVTPDNTPTGFTMSVTG